MRELAPVCLSTHAWMEGSSMTNIIQFISKTEASRVLEERVEQIKVDHPHLSVDEQIDIMAEFITNADPQIQREAARHYWDMEQD